MKMLLVRSGAPILRRMSSVTASDVAQRLSLPDMTEREKHFVDDQVDALLRPSWLEGQKLLDLDPEGRPSVNLLDPAVFSTLFPTTKGYEAMTKCIQVVRSNGYKDFKVHPHISTTMKRNLQYPLIAERAARALKVYNVEDEELAQTPKLIYTIFKDLSSIYRSMEIYDHESSISNIMQHRKKKPLRGQQILNYINETVKCLELLGMEEIAEKFKKQVVVKLQDSKAVTYEYLKHHCVSQLLREIMRLEGSKNEFKIKNNLDSVDIARNYYILRKMLDMDDIGMMVQRSSPLEMLIILRTRLDVYETLSPGITMDEFIDVCRQCPGTKSEMRVPCMKLPVACKALFLLNMGFNKEEVRAILENKEGIRFKAQADDDTLHKAYQLSSLDYLSVMKNRLTILKSDNTNKKLGLVSAPDHFKFMKRWKNSLTSVGSEAYGPNANGTKENKQMNDFLTGKAVFLVIKHYFADQFTRSEIAKRIDVPNTDPEAMISNIILLIDMGFSMDEISSSLEIVAFPPSKVVQALSDIDESEPHRLNLALFTLDRMNEFSATRSLRREALSNEFLEETKRQVLAVKTEELCQEIKDELEDELVKVFEPRLISSPSLSVPVRMFSTHTSTRNMTTKSIVKTLLPYWGNPTKKLYAEFQFNALRRDLDPDLNSKDIIAGAKAAVAIVTQLIHKNRFDDLKGLLSSRELERVQREVETVWPDTWRDYILMEPDEIDLVMFENFRLHKMPHTSFLDIGLRLACRKEHTFPKVGLGIDTTLSREYKEGSLKDWTITKFAVLFCEPF